MSRLHERLARLVGELGERFLTSTAIPASPASAAVAGAPPGPSCSRACPSLMPRAMFLPRVWGHRAAGSRTSGSAFARTRRPDLVTASRTIVDAHAAARRPPADPPATARRSCAHATWQPSAATKLQSSSSGPPTIGAKPARNSARLLAPSALAALALAHCATCSLAPGRRQQAGQPTRLPQPGASGPRRPREKSQPRADRSRLVRSRSATPTAAVAEKTGLQRGQIEELNPAARSAAAFKSGPKVQLRVNEALGWRDIVVGLRHSARSPRRRRRPGAAAAFAERRPPRRRSWSTLSGQGVILRKGPDQQRPIASTTKLMTALLALVHTRPGESFTARRPPRCPRSRRSTCAPGSG